MKFLSILRASAACTFIAIITPAAAEEAADTTIIVTGRVAADLARQMSLPSGTDSINIPTITTGNVVSA